MWVAKGVLSNKIYSSEYNCVYSCQCFIDRECDKFIINELELFIEKFDIQGYLVAFYDYEGKIDLNNKHHFEFVLDLFRLQFSNPIRCYNIYQGRYANGFDF